MSSEVQIAVIDQQDTQIVLAVPGVQGATGSEIAAGGTANQVLRKASSTDYDTDWSLVTSAMIEDGAIVNADVNASAAIAGTKISPNFGSQNVVTTGTSTAASFIPTSSSVPTNGVYLPSANNVAISTNGSRRLTIDSDGNICAGSANPVSALDLRNDLPIFTTIRDTGSITADMLLGAFNAYSRDLTPNSIGGVGGVRVYAEATYNTQTTPSYLSFWTHPAIANNDTVLGAAQERARIDSSGRLLVGTTSSVSSAANAAVEVIGAGSQGGELALGRNDTSITVDNSIGIISFWGNDSDSLYDECASITAFADGTHGDDSKPTRLQFSTTADGQSTPDPRMTIKADGKVGIGTTEPGASLHVAGTGATIRVGDGERIDLIPGANANDPSLIVSSTGSALTFASNGASEMARLDTSGRLLVGTTTTSAASTALLQASSAGSTTQAILTLARGQSSPADAALLGSLRYADSGHVSAAEINVRRDGGTWTSNVSQPTRIEFSTTPDGDNSPDPRMTIKADGKVGIGTETPGELLHISSATGGPTPTPTSLRIETTTSSASWSTTDPWGEINFYSTDPSGGGPKKHAVIDVTSEDANGSRSTLGIKLSGATSSTSTRLSISSAGTTTLTSASSTDPFIVNVSTTEAARIDSSGRLLVGTALHSGVSCKVEISDPGPAIINLRRADDSIGTNNSIGEINFVADDPSAGKVGANIAAVSESPWDTDDYPTRLVFSTTADGASSPTERMRLDSLGQNQVFTADVSGAVCFSAHHAGGAGSTRLLFSGRYSATGTGNGTQSFRVESSGDVKNTNNSYGAISDIKLKENIVDANSQWDDLKALQVRKYNFKEGQTHTQIGLIAQEVELVSPGLVSESPDRDEDGNDLGTVTKSVNYSVLYMKAVKALQEAMERIEQLEAKVAALEGN